MVAYTVRGLLQTGTPEIRKMKSICCLSFLSLTDSAVSERRIEGTIMLVAGKDTRELQRCHYGCGTQRAPSCKISALFLSHLLPQWHRFYRKGKLGIQSGGGHKPNPHALEHRWPCASHHICNSRHTFGTLMWPRYMRLLAAQLYHSPSWPPRLKKQRINQSTKENASKDTLVSGLSLS